MTRCSPRAPLRALLAASLLALAATPALAQTGTIRGTVAGPGGAAVAGAQVSVAGTRISTTTTPTGAFTLSNVPTGTQRVRVSASGHRTQFQEVVVGAAEPALLAISLEQHSVELDPMVVSASRRAERLTEAPATITRIGPEVLEASVGNSFAGALREVKGLDFIQVGVNSVAINARGFNSSFNNRMLMMEDGRISVLPENGLPVGQFTPTPKVDLEGIEVLVGPGSALYGADASSGVISLSTKDPRAYPGTTVEVTGGTRQYKDVQFRHAGVFSNFGYKVAGEFQDANDWNNFLAYTNGGVRLREDSIKQPIDWDSRVARGTGALVYYQGDSRLELAGGMSRTDGVGQTNVGRNQLTGWGYNFVQARFSTPRIYLNAYRSQSTSGESFALNRFAAAQSAQPGLSSDSLRALSDWPSDGRLYAAEFQNNFRAPFLLNTAVIWGAQLRRDQVSSKRQWLSDRLTGEDVSINQYGVYAQATTPVHPMLDVVLAARLDDHENYDRQFSPKAGVVFKPADGHALRATYNRAFKSPTILQTNFHIPDWNAVTTIYGNTRGFTVKNAAGETVATYDPLQPEENTSFELGYKGVFQNRLFVDVAAYQSDYENFMSPLAVIANPFTAAPTIAFDADGNQINSVAGGPALMLAYYNLGSATLRGLDAGLNYMLTPRVSFKGTVSLVELEDVEVPAGREEATALNSPATKWTLGTNLANFETRYGTLQGSMTARHVNGYYFRSGINMGRIPTFSTLDASIGFRVNRLNSLLNVGVSNLFSCVGKFSYADELPADDPRRASDPLRQSPVGEERGCGFGKRHIEMVNMPEIGTMLFVGMQFQTR